MKKYAIRSKETGLWLGAEHGSLVFNENKGGFFGEDEVQEWRDLSFVESEHYEVVTLRIEPTEPCEWCETYGGEMIAPSDDLYAFECALDAEDWTFCPNCGRRLGDE